MALDAIASAHSYAQGFNGRLSRYRIFRLEEHLGHVAQRRSVLEIGAGEGPITRYLIERFAHVTALEPAQAYFDALQRGFAGCDTIALHQGLLEEFTSDARYDAVVAAGVLEHVAEPIDFLRRAASLLNADGALFLTVPNAGSLHRQVGLRMGMLARLDELGELDRRVGHYRYYDFARLRSDVEAAGLQPLALKGIVLKPLPNSGMDALSVEYCDALYAIGDDLPDYCAEIFVCARPSGDPRSGR